MSFFGAYFGSLSILSSLNIYLWTFCWIDTILRIGQEVFLYKIFSVLSLIHCYDMNEHLLFIQFGLAVVSPRGERLTVLVSVEGEQGDAEAEGVEHLVLDRAQQNLQLLRLHRDRAGAEVGVAGDGPAAGHITHHTRLLSRVVL